MPTDLVKLVDRLKADEEEFWLSPAQWKNSKVPSDLTWDWVSFDKKDKENVPTCRGVYAFIVELFSPGIPPHGYVMYVGETGNTGRETLRSRFSSYFTEMESESRAVHYALKKYKKYLYFHFSEISDKRRNLLKVETALCDTLIPPYNIKDFSVEIRRAKKAF